MAGTFHPELSLIDPSSLVWWRGPRKTNRNLLLFCLVSSPSICKFLGGEKKAFARAHGPPPSAPHVPQLLGYLD